MFQIKSCVLNIPFIRLQNDGNTVYIFVKTFAVLMLHAAIQTHPEWIGNLSADTPAHCYYVGYLQRLLRNKFSSS